MKLRNKKTGQHGECKVVSAGCLIRVRNCDTNESYQYDCIAGFNDNWEDYTPTEPLIKDEKIRKAIRTWAEVLHIDQDNIKVSIGSHRTSIIGWQPGLIDGYSIDFPNILNELHGGMQTTIAELCGEEKE